MGMKWNPDFDKKSYRGEARAGAQEILQKAGAKKWVAAPKRRVTKYAEGKSFSRRAHEKSRVTRDFVFPGALVKLVGNSKAWCSASYCTVVSLSAAYAGWGGESVGSGRYWDCIMPDGTVLSINSGDMRPIEVQNGNVIPGDED